MKKVFSSKRRVAAIGVLTAATLVGGGMAVAYWTTTGTGTGSATVGAPEDNITVVGTVTGDLAPGRITSDNVSFKASNPADFNQKLSKITLASVTPDSTHALCVTDLGTDFSMEPVSVEAEGNLAPGASDISLTATGTLKMLDSTENQDACQGATLTLAFTTS